MSKKNPKLSEEELSDIENEPLFTVFMEALYINTINHPENLKDLSDIFDERADKLLEGVNLDED